MSDIIECRGCGGVYPAPKKNQRSFLIKIISFQIARRQWENFELCNGCSEAITEEATAKIRGKKMSNAEANYAIGRVAYAFVGDKKGRSLAHNEHATWQVDTKSSVHKGGNMALRFFKDGDTMGLQTDCETESEFILEFSAALDEMIAEKKFEHDWYFQLNIWLPQFVDIVCAYRGYKSADVKKSVVLTVGQLADVVFEKKQGEQNKPMLNGFAKTLNG